jgi:hypothetical protein
MTDSLIWTMPFLVIQLYSRSSDAVNINLHIRNTARDSFKFCFTTVERRNPTRASKMSTIIPLEKVPHDIWVNLCFDLGLIVRRHWPVSDAVFESLQGIEITPPCMIRWLFVIQNPLRPDSAGQDLPQQVRFSGGIESTTVLIGDTFPRLLGRSPTAKVASPRPSGHAQGRSDHKAQERIANGQQSDDETDLDVFHVETPGGKSEEEGELTLVFIDTLGCYYCPDNQRYYQIDPMNCD